MISPAFFSIYSSNAFVNDAKNMNTFNALTSSHLLMFFIIHIVTTSKKRLRTQSTGYTKHSWVTSSSDNIKQRTKSDKTIHFAQYFKTKWK